MKQIGKKPKLELFFFALGILSAALGLLLNTNAAMGFGISFGLCMIATAIIELGNRTGEPRKPEEN